jgi:hypothetical protein
MAGRNSLRGLRALPSTQRLAIYEKSARPETSLMMTDDETWQHREIADKTKNVEELYAGHERAERLRGAVSRLQPTLRNVVEIYQSRDTAERLVNFIAILCVLGWQIFWLTMMNRSIPDASPGLAFTSLEVILLDKLVQDRKDYQSRTKPLSTYLIKLARLGSYLARAHDPPPGNMVLWRGLSRLTDLQLGFLLATQLMGN